MGLVGLVETSGLGGLSGPAETSGLGGLSGPGRSAELAALAGLAKLGELAGLGELAILAGLAGLAELAAPLGGCSTGLPWALGWIDDFGPDDDLAGRDGALERRDFLALTRHPQRGRY